MRPRLRRALIVFAVLVVALVASFRPLVMYAITPHSPFAPARVPPPPDYSDARAWAALPGRVAITHTDVRGLTASPASPAIDVFYVHPTTYVGTDWNGAYDSPAVITATHLGGTRIQASAFAACCAIYAPRYRQANLTAFTAPSPDGARALAVAGDDVVTAFRWYIANENRGRPFILAGHSQGAVHAFRLLADEIARTPLRARLVAAYLIGSPVSEATLAATGIAACDSPTQTGCVVAWNARSPSYSRGIDYVEAHPTSPASPRVCVNPLTWRHDEATAARSLHHGAVFFEGLDELPTVRPAFADARCDHGTLRVTFDGSVPRDLPSRVLDGIIGEGNYHPIEVGLFYVNLRENAAARVAAFTR